MRIYPRPELEFGPDRHGLVDGQFTVVGQIGQSSRRFLVQSHLILESSRRLFHDSWNPRTVWAGRERKHENA